MDPYSRRSTWDLIKAAKDGVAPKLAATEKVDEDATASVNASFAITPNGIRLAQSKAGQ